MSVLSWTPVVAQDAVPERTLVFLHGIFGRGTNFRTFAQRLVDAHPTWAAALVDLRMHGDSQGFPPPHTVEAAAADLEALDSQLPARVGGVLGHSFGGKVALAYLARHAATLSHAFILDSNPGPSPRGDLPEQVLVLLERLPIRWSRREDFVARLESEDIPRAIGQWLAMNLVPAAGGFRFGLELPAIRVLLEDYAVRDYRKVLSPPPASVRVRFVLGGRSRVVPPETRDQLERAGGRLDVVTLPEAGHWVHTDDPEGTFNAVHQGLQ